jgi:hypothetical protein
MVSSGSRASSEITLGMLDATTTSSFLAVEDVKFLAPPSRGTKELMCSIFIKIIFANVIVTIITVADKGRTLISLLPPDNPDTKSK